MERATLVGIMILLVFITGVLFVLFGQITVRKLRKNPATKDTLGAEFASGWDILNVASALSRPKWISKRLRRSSLSSLSADELPIYDHTNRFDRRLGKLFFGFFVSTGTLSIATVILDLFGLLG